MQEHEACESGYSRPEVATARVGKVGSEVWPQAYSGRTGREKQFLLTQMDRFVFSNAFSKFKHSHLTNTYALLKLALVHMQAVLRIMYRVPFYRTFSKKTLKM
jgi:hypothetical protein